MPKCYQKIIIPVFVDSDAASNLQITGKSYPATDATSPILLPNQPIYSIKNVEVDSSKNSKILGHSLDRKPPLSAGLSAAKSTPQNPASSLSVDSCCQKVTENNTKTPWSLTAELKRRNFAITNNKDRRVAETNSNDFKLPFSYFTSSTSNEGGKLNKKAFTAKSVQALNDLRLCTKGENQFSEIRPVVSATNSLQRKSSVDYSNDHNNNSNKQSSSLFKRLTRSDMRFSVKVKQGKKERLESWANDFDVLLRDPAGLYAFS
uniref:Uncharacterized protein n=1 Tax=Romanomermis culicivorax TaxID=13658 RepID=A0A915L9J5_ROMCU